MDSRCHTFTVSVFSVFAKAMVVSRCHTFVSHFLPFDSRVSGLYSEIMLISTRHFCKRSRLFPYCTTTMERVLIIKKISFRAWRGTKAASRLGVLALKEMFRQWWCPGPFSRCMHIDACMFVEVYKSSASTIKLQRSNRMIVVT